MAVATLTAKGQVVIPAEIRARHELTPGTQVEFVDEGGVIRLVVRRRVAASDPALGYGMVRVAGRRSAEAPRKLSEFDPATLLSLSKAARARR